MTRRTNWWTYFYGHYGNLAVDANFERCLKVMRSYRRHRKLDLDYKRLEIEFKQGERTYCRLYSLMQAQCAERAGRPRWGDKSLNTERYADTVFECFPDARIVHVVRDPRDRYASALKRWQSHRGGVGSATAEWLTSIKLGERNEAAHPGRYRMLAYEELVRDPDQTLRSLSSFLNEQYDPQMLAMSAESDFRDAGGNSSFGRYAAGEISPRSVGRFRNVLSGRQVTFMQRVAGRKMEQYGYEPVAVEMSAIDRLGYRVLTLPVNMAKMLLWRLRERAYDVVGRSPAAHTLLQERA
jgi:hypothetical protein